MGRGLYYLKSFKLKKKGFEWMSEDGMIIDQIDSIQLNLTTWRRVIG